MRLTREDKEMLEKNHHLLPTDFPRVEMVLNRTTFHYAGKRITAGEALDVLGRRLWLQGLMACLVDRQCTLKTPLTGETVMFNAKMDYTNNKAFYVTYTSRSGDKVAVACPSMESANSCFMRAKFKSDFLNVKMNVSGKLKSKYTVIPLTTWQEQNP